MSTTLQIPPASDALTALRIRFTTEPKPAESVLASFVHPSPVSAALEKIDAGDLAIRSDPAPTEEGLLVLCLPTGSPIPPAWRRWLQRDDTCEPAIEVAVLDQRLYWRSGLAVIQGSTTYIDDIMPALAEFAFIETELRRLEQELADDWQPAQADTRLTHGLTAGDLKEAARVNRMTRRAALRRMHFATLEHCFESPTYTRSQHARQLFGQLRDKARIPARLESLDDRIEIVSDLYEVANDRLTEYSYFRREYSVELWIVVILLAEVLLLLLELWKLERLLQSCLNLPDANTAEGGCASPGGSFRADSAG